jgi:hypothetical protein
VTSILLIIYITGYEEIFLKLLLFEAQGSLSLLTNTNVTRWKTCKFSRQREFRILQNILCFHFCPLLISFLLSFGEWDIQLLSSHAQEPWGQWRKSTLPRSKKMVTRPV